MAWPTRVTCDAGPEPGQLGASEHLTSESLQPPHARITPLHPQGKLQAERQELGAGRGQGRAADSPQLAWGSQV